MSEDWEKFWAVYPRKVAKGDARKAWSSTASIRPPIADIVAAIRAQSQGEQWRKDYGTYIPYPATWLRQERWDDATTIDLPAPERKKDRFDLANEEQARRDAEWAARAAVRKAAA
jgi:hypothetical protein